MTGPDASRRPWSATAAGVVVTVRLTPRGGRDAVDGIEERADGQCVLKARVRAAATEGEANAALLKLIARTLRVPPRDVSLVAGPTSRVKRVAVAGDGPTLMAALEKVIRGVMPRESGASSKLDKAR